MLDFRKLAHQIKLVDRESFVDVSSKLEIEQRAQQVFQDAAFSGKQFVDKLDYNKPWTMWPLVTPLEPLESVSLVEKRTQPVTVIGIDGSQIMPSHHEVHTCYLLNIGVALISYGSKAPPVLESYPKLYYRPDDLYPLVDRRRLHIDELYISLERSIMELETLAEKSLEAQSRSLPVVAMYDGSLISWSVEKLPGAYQNSFIERTTKCLETLRTNRIPVVGYLSHSRSADVINALRVSICPFEVSHCREHCQDLSEDEFPCSKIWPMSDRQLFTGRLKENEVSSTFLTGASVSKLFPVDHRICLAYLHVGDEVARLEFPRWVFEDGELFQLTVSTVLAQAEKGMGYPIALSEAHHLAVVKGADRDRFFELIAQQLIELGVTKVRPSPKESKKRTGFI